MDGHARLLEQMDQGSIAAFDEFYESYAPFVYQIALALTKNKSEAEDLCHDIFLEVYRKPHQFNPRRGTIKAWLAVKTKSRFIDSLRKKNRWQLEPGEELFDKLIAEDNSEEMVLSKMEKDVIMRAIEKLPKTQKEALLGKYYLLKTQKEIASDMQKPIGTIKSFLRYGLHNLKKQLIQVGWVRGDQSHEKL